MRSMLCTRAQYTDDGRSGQRCRYNWLRAEQSGDRNAVEVRFSETVQVIGISFQAVKRPGSSMGTHASGTIGIFGL
jgi:hypothetical protein